MPRNPGLLYHQVLVARAIMQARSKPNTSAEYHNLPESVKMAITEKEYCWLSEAEKRNLETDFSQPDYVED